MFDHFLGVLIALTQHESTRANDFVFLQLKYLPEHIRKANLHKLKAEPSWWPWAEPKLDLRKSIVEKILLLAPLKQADTAWSMDVLDSLTHPLPRDYANDVLIAVLLEKKYPEGPLSALLRQACIDDLKSRTATKPTPPPDWRRQVPTVKSNREIWEMLRPFLESPTERVFEYRKSEAYRQQMASAINSVTIDLGMETIRKGSPHTLKLIKTQGAYERALREWKEDVRWMEKLGGA